MAIYKLKKPFLEMPGDWQIGMELGQADRRGALSPYSPVNGTYTDKYLESAFVENTPDIFELWEPKFTNDIFKLRYMVLTPWPPNSPFAKESIVTPDQFTGWHPKDFPIIFREMPWYEAREVRDMPKYLKSHQGNSVRQVKHYELHWNKVVFIGGAIRPLKQLLPATEQEYVEFTQKNVQL